MFDSIATLAVAQNMQDLYRLVLIDTPLAPYFSDSLSAEDLDEMNVEIMRNMLYKAYLDDFSRFCEGLGGTTGEVMTDLLAFEVRTRAARSMPVVACMRIATTTDEALTDRFSTPLVCRDRCSRHQSFFDTTRSPH